MRSERERLSSDDEIDLFELVAEVWRQKLLVVLVTVVVTGGAVAYALLAKPTYEAKVFVLPPTQNDIAQLNYGRGGQSDLAMLSIKDVYGVYLRNLRSESLRREFFQSVYLPSLSKEERNGSQDELYRNFQAVLRVGEMPRESADRFFVQAELSNPKLAADWVVQYAELAGLRARSEITQDIKADATVKADNLEQEISAARLGAQKQREDQIAQLTEALRVARSIGLEKPPIITNNLSSEVSASMDGSLTYMRGTKALEAEIDNLRKRASDDPFVRDLRPRQEALAFYRNLKVNPESVRVYQQDGAIESPDKPVKPKKLFIVLVGGLVGGALGVLAAVVRSLGWRRVGKTRYQAS